MERQWQKNVVGEVQVPTPAPTQAVQVQMQQPPMQQMQMQQAQQPIVIYWEKTKETGHRVLANRWALAGIVFMMVFAIFLIIRPGMLYNKDGCLLWSRIFWFSLLAAVIVLLVPYILKG